MAVYFIQCTGSKLIKIGYSKKPTQRLDELQTGSPYHLSLIKVMEGTRSKERDLHSRFRKYRTRGEWYVPALEIIFFINDQRRMAYDLWLAFPMQAGFTIVTESGKVQASAQLVTITVSNNQNIYLSVDPYAAITSNRDYLSFQSEGKIKPSTLRALDHLAQTSGFLPCETILKEGMSQIGWKSKQKLLKPEQASKTIADIYNALQ